MRPVQGKGPDAQQGAAAAWNDSARAILDAIPGEAFLVDASHRILAANGDVRALRQDLAGPVGLSCNTFCHGTEQSPHGCPLSAAATGNQRTTRKVFDPLKRRWTEVAVSPTALRTDDGEPVYLHVCRDITQQWTVAARQVQSREHERAISEILRGLQRCPDSAAILDFLLTTLTSLSWLGVTVAGAGFLVEAGKLRMVTQRNLSEQVLAMCETVDVGTCLCGRAAAKGEMLVRSHLDEEHDLVHEAMEDHGHAILPLLHEGNCLGVLNLYLDAGQNLDRAQRTFLDSAASASAVALAGRLAQERELAARDRLAAYERQQAVGRLAGGVANDFNNLMTVILSLTDFVKSELDPADQAQADLAGIRDAATQASNLARQLSAFACTETVRPVVVDLNAVLRDAGRTLERTWGQTIAVQLDLDEDLSDIRIDPIQLDQLVMNLASNAREAMPEGGTLRIATRPALQSGEDAHLRLPVTPGACVRLTVQDSGQGMTRQVSDRLFEPFFTTKEHGKGTGMGLATVFGIVEQARGNLSVHSAPGQGATFHVYLPIADPHETAPGLVYTGNTLPA